MENNSPILQCENIAPPKSQESLPHKPFSIISVRVISCFIIISICLFIKVKKPETFEQIRLWYQENICCDMINTQEIKEHLQNLLDSTFSQINQIYNNYIKPNL